MGERVAESWCCLNRREGKLSNVIRLVKPENSFDLIEVYMLLHSNDVGVQMLYVLDV